MLGEGTKAAPALMYSGKEYVGLLELHGDVSDDELLKAFELFTGDIYQVPPVRAAVARRPRVRTVYYNELLERDGRMVLFKVGCSGGTYIRKLCHDIGEYLGVGAHMQELRRVRAGPFTENKSHTVLDLYEAWTSYKQSGESEALLKIVRPVEDCVELLPKVYILDTAVDAVCHGADLMAAGVSKLDPEIKAGDFVAVMSLKNELVAFGRALMSGGEMLEAMEGPVVDTVRVVMPRSTYAPVWKGGLRRKTS
ncbi:MAG: RNA-guided pseudouridylation complex pseudouridine synthase subunit Cbf5 [Candidatus Caldarchaeum sp.]